MQASPVIIFLVSSCLLCGITTTAAMPMPDIGDFPTQDSYAVIPQQLEDREGDTELNLEIVPPAPIVDTSGGPHLYYMNSDGVAEPVDQEQKRLLRKRAAFPEHVDETLLTDETVIVGPPSGQRPFGTPAVQLGFRPARAYYARRYHKYPWNYH